MKDKLSRPVRLANAKFPNTIIEVKSMVRGRIKGIKVGVIYNKNFATTAISKSFPASSDIYNQTACKTKISMRITNTLINVFKYVFNMYQSSIFTL